MTCVQRALAKNCRQLAAGNTADDLNLEAVAAANHAFDLLRSGLAAHYD